MKKAKPENSNVISINGKEYKVFLGIRAMAKFDEISEVPYQEMLKKLAAFSKGNIEPKYIKNIAQLYYCALKPIKDPLLDFDAFYDAIDEDTDLFEEIQNIVINHLQEKKK